MSQIPGPQYQPGTASWPPAWPVVGDVNGTPVVAPPPAPSRVGLVLATLALVFGALLLLAGVIGPQVPVSDGYSLSQVNDVCRSGLGQVAQGMSHEAHDNCTKIGWLSDAAWVAIVGGLLFIGSGIAGLWQRRRTARFQVSR